MSLEHIFRNLNDIRVFDAMSYFNDEQCALEIKEILDLLDYPPREFIQTEDSVKHLTSQKILNIVLVPTETTTGCEECKENIPRKSGHEDHIPFKKETIMMSKYYLSDNELTKYLISAVMTNSFNFSEEC